MSNAMDHSIDSSVKKISIKPLTYIQQTYAKKEPEQSERAQEKNLQTSIAQAEARLQTLKQEQQQLQEQTAEQIEQLRANWDEEREKLIAEAKEEGYQAGFESGKNEAQKQYTDIINEANQLTKTAEEEHILRIEQSTSSLIELAVEIANKIMNREMEENSDALQTLVQAAVQEVKDQSEVHIYVPPAHYESMLLQKKEFTELMHAKAQLSIYIAPEGECYITHPLGKIDVSIDTQLTQMREKLIEIAMENQL